MCGIQYNKSKNKVCSKCIKDAFMHNYIRKNGHKAKCDFCGANRNCIMVDDLLDRISCYISFSYDDDLRPFEAGEPVSSGIDGYDILEDITESFSPKLKEHVYDCFNSLLDQSFSEKTNKYGETERDFYWINWIKFSNQIKYQTRYFFIKQNVNEYDMPPYKILDIIARNVRRLRLLTHIKKDTVVFRARKQAKGLDFRPSKETMDAPPSKYAHSNRMSPAGIRLFYGGSLESTAIKEINYDAAKEDCYVSRWIVSQDVLLLDFSKNIDRISVFDKNNLRDLAIKDFFVQFLIDINKPITSSSQDTIELQRKKELEYVPSQVVSEFFRCVYSLRKKIKLSGICYKSNKGGLNYAFFFPKSKLFSETTDSHVLQYQATVKI